MYWAAIVKDLEMKGFYIRMVDKEVRAIGLVHTCWWTYNIQPSCLLQEKIMVREKKVGKQFQYDMPSDLLMTFLSEVSNTFS